MFRGFGGAQRRFLSFIPQPPPKARLLWPYAAFASIVGTYVFFDPKIEKQDPYVVFVLGGRNYNDL